MRKIGMFLATLILAVVAISGTARAQTGSVGCGAVTGVTLLAATSCTGTLNNPSAGSYNSTGIGVTLTSISGVPSSVLQVPSFAEELTTNNEIWDFSFNASTTASTASPGTFTLTDTDGGVNACCAGTTDFILSGFVTNLTAVVSGPTTTLTLTLDPRSAGLGDENFGFPQGVPISISGYTGTVTIVDPPNGITSLNGTFDLPLTAGSNPNGVTPEPGTLLLLGSGLTGIGFLRRRFTSV